MTSLARKRLRTFTCTDEEWAAFMSAVKAADPEMSASRAIRELCRWYAGGCGGQLRLIIPLRFPPGAGTV
jgi:hypothetical protein